MEESLGKYLVILRKEKLNIEVSRQMAKKLEITPQYMHDIENDNRIPSKRVLNKIEKVFNLNQREKEKLYDLASNSYKEKKVPEDIAAFIIENDDAKIKIRRMMKEYKNKEGV